MNSPAPALNPHLEAALQRVRFAVEQAAERCAEGLGMSALAAGQVKRRDALLSAQFLFRKQQAIFGPRFYASLRALMAAEHSQKAAVVVRKDWTELSLMDDDQVDALVAADRIGLALGHQSEWELREVESFVAGLNIGERNPLRPELIAQALLEAVQTVSEEPEARQILTDEMTRALAQELRACYRDIADMFSGRGLRKQDMRVRGADSGPGMAQTSSRTLPLDSHSAHSAHSAHGDLPGGRHPQQQYGGRTSGSTAAGSFGDVDVHMMDLLRRLAHMPAASFGQFQSALSQPGDLPLPPNLIHQHRDELRLAATGQLDHMVIDVVGSLFDQILADPKVPPQMARLLAQLQLPVLRVALGDPTFFSSRRHAVRRFINRLASLACAFDDFAEEPGRDFLNHTRELVQDVASGDFERMDVYERKLDALEQFIADQTAAAVMQHGDAAGLLARKETDLRLQQRYTQQLQTALLPVPMEGFLRDFLAQVWSQAIVLASRSGTPERALRLRQMGRELVMSMQPKGGSAQRKTFLGQLPVLMRTLTEGLDLIAWPEPARKAFFGVLLPAHAESLKGVAPSALDTNLLIRQLDNVFGCAPPNEQELPSGAAVTVPQDLDMGQRLTPEEAKSLGLIDESGVDWDGSIDIELGGEEPTALAAVDISIEGLPAAAEAPEPSSGALLIDHLQLGFAYQMHTGDSWHKTRLAHISAGRSFFIFTQGAKHQQTVTMTARMLRRMCEAGRLRGFENAYLLERATARARKQLAALKA